MDTLEIFGTVVGIPSVGVGRFQALLLAVARDTIAISELLPVGTALLFPATVITHFVVVAGPRDRSSLSSVTGRRGERCHLDLTGHRLIVEDGLGATVPLLPATVGTDHIDGGSRMGRGADSAFLTVGEV